MYKSNQWGPRRRQRTNSRYVSAVVWLKGARLVSTRPICARLIGPSLIVAAVLCAALSPSPARAATTDIKVMSFNVRTANAADGLNDWDGNRKNLAEQVIRDFGPDIVGYQEDLKRQRDFLADQFPAFDFVGRGAQGGNDGEYNAIMYRASRFTNLRNGTFWLSTTPDVPGSQSWDAAFPRTVTWIELRDNNNPSFTFIVMNTHWDHASSDARFESAKLIRSKVPELASGIPVVLTGDFNADQGGAAYQRMRGIDDAPGDTVRNFQDTYRNISPGDSDTVGTAHGFDGTTGGGRIDWILHDNDFRTIDADIVRTFYNTDDGKRYPSDHFPITAVIAPVPEPTGLALLGLAALVLRRSR